MNKASQRCFEVGFAYSNNATSKKELLQLELSRTAAPLGKVPRWVSQPLGYQAPGLSLAEILRAHWPGSQQVNKTT